MSKRAKENETRQASGSLAVVEQPSASAPTLKVETGTLANELFGRIINNPQAVTHIVVKQTLTRPLVSVAHKREMVVGMLGELYEMELPLAGRTDKPAPASVVDCLDFESKDECTLVCNAVMVSAFKRDGKPLKGRIFALEGGEIRTDKRYRVVDVKEIAFEDGAA